MGDHIGQLPEQELWEVTKLFNKHAVRLRQRSESQKDTTTDDMKALMKDVQFLQRQIRTSHDGVRNTINTNTFSCNHRVIGRGKKRNTVLHTIRQAFQKHNVLHMDMQQELPQPL